LGGSIAGRSSGVRADNAAGQAMRRVLRADDPPNIIVRRRDEIVLDEPVELHEERRQPRMRAVIADAHAVTRHGMRALLGLCGNVEVVSEAATATEVVKNVVEYVADLALIDLDLPDPDCIHAIRRIRQEAPFAKVLVLSARDAEEEAVRAMRAGASAFLSKSAGTAEFKAAIESLRAGGTYLDAGATATIRSALDRNGGSKGKLRSRLGELTEREVEIARLISDGLTARRIASQLGISDRTVNSHVGNLYRRLSVNNRVDAVRELMRLGIAPSPR
jgi:DNA-binding NarL/FixJ family response regulator